MDLSQIYRPIEKELEAVEQVLKMSLKETKHSSILEVTHYLLGARGKRIRPALVILSTKAALKQKSTLRLRSPRAEHPARLDTRCEAGLMVSVPRLRSGLVLSLSKDGVEPSVYVCRIMKLPLR